MPLVIYASHICADLSVMMYTKYIPPTQAGKFSIDLMGDGYK